MKPMLTILLLMLFSCSNNKPVLISNLVTRGGLVYEHTYYSIFNGEGVNIADTPFSGECIAYWPTGEISGQGTFKDGILIYGAALGKDGTIYESWETNGDTTIHIEWYSNGQKRWENSRSSNRF